MRILFDSKKTEYKQPFGCLVPGEACVLHIHIPCTIKTAAVCVVLENEDGSAFCEFPFVREDVRGDYEIWRCGFSMPKTGLYFYHFRITDHTGTFRLFKYGDDTNMEDGSQWQLSCVPADHTTPDWAKGAVIYQVFPDRFCKKDDCDLTGKLEPYVLHESWDEEVFWQPDEKGVVHNNDFYGGNFRGITEKMDYIASLGTGILYLNPICKSFSSHRYDTADYLTPDPMLGTLEDFTALCDAAHKRNIRVVLDGVFSHTGANSVYFDKEGIFGGGAYSDSDSPYRQWYRFRNYPKEYESWWGFDTLPALDKENPDYAEFACKVIRHWLLLGADGFRLDVADELPDTFIAKLKTTLRDCKPDALLMGEVWEDASNKIAYGVRRRYFVDGELDSVMNYPFRTAILDFLWGRDDGRNLRNTVLTVLENYPGSVALANMNLLGSHDTPRILTALNDEFDGDRAALAERKLPPENREHQLARLRLAAVLQYALPGCPSIFYGDEAGMEGGKDPFNRRTYPWGQEDQELLQFYRYLGQLRSDHPALRLGDTEFFCAEQGRIGILRRLDKDSVRFYVNLAEQPWQISAGTEIPTMGWMIESEDN